MDVVVWLRSSGLGKYDAAFRESNETVLPKSGRRRTEGTRHLDRGA